MRHATFRGVRWIAPVVLAAVGLSSTTPLQAQTPPPPPNVPLTQLDVSKNDYINATDAIRVISAWTEIQQAGAQCSTGQSKYDVDKSGCIDVADAQLVAAYIGEVSGPKGAMLSRGVVGKVTDGATLVVNSDGNESDTNPGDGQCSTSAGTCTLRAAIQESNVLPGHETIKFNIKKNGSYPNVITIYPPSYSFASGEENPNDSWFDIDDPLDNGVTIDGYSQPGASPNTSDVPNNAKVVIELKGRAQIGVHGIRIASANNVIKGLAFYNWDRQVFIESSSARYNRIEGNIIGTNTSFTFKQSNMGTQHSEGIRLQYGASYNIIGCGDFNGTEWAPCTDAVRAQAARNMVTGTGNDGIHLQRSPVTNNHIAGNWLGLKPDGVSFIINKSMPHGIGSDAVDFEEGPQYNWLGGETALERNVISGSKSEGIEVSLGTDTQYNRIVGNYFGLDATGTKGVRNCGNGISFEDTPNNNFAYNNVIGSNYGSGVRIYRRSTYNEVYGNKIGVAADGVSPLPNGVNDSNCQKFDPGADYGGSGVYITGGSQYNNIHDNLIANHPENGVKITVSTVEGGDEQKFGKTQSTNFNTISKNSMYNNRLDGIQFNNGGKYKVNQGIAGPELILASTKLVTGKACPSCKVEVFLADANLTGVAGEGKTFLGDGTADSNGDFAVTIQQTQMGDALTATATDAQGNTSQFSMNIKVTQDAAVLETAVAATAQVEANAQATSIAATAAVQTATAQAEATQTTIVLQTSPALAGTATAQAATATAQATPAPFEPKYKVLLPMISR